MLHSINVFIHITVGLIAILVGIIPYVTQKGGYQHRRFGRFFLLLMSIVIITSLSGVLFFRDRPFLTIVTLLSFYTSYSGYRVLKTKEKGFTKIDFGVILLVLFMATGLTFQMTTSNVFWHNSVVFYLLGYIFLLLGFDMFRYLFPKIIRIKNFWLYEHIYKMTGSFNALISAGSGTALQAYEPYNQILPAIFTTVWLVFCLIYFPRKMNAKTIVKDSLK